MAAQHMPLVTPDEYLDQEELASTKHMYYRGVVTSMAGGSSGHATAAMNLAAELR
jgi:hypothetical protein